jgi:hypothetical protein
MKRQMQNTGQNVDGASAPNIATPQGTDPGNGAAQPQAQSALSQEERRGLIEREAYLRAERRGFEGGDPVDDWLAAEAEVEAQIERNGGSRDEVRH